MRHSLTVATVLATAMVFTPVLAGADEPAPEAPDDACRVETIPAHTRVVERTIVEPELRAERHVPRYESATVAVYETKHIPVHGDVEVPVFETKEVPVYRTERIPVWGEKEVTAYREVREPVSVQIWNPFRRGDSRIKLWDKRRHVPDGTKTVRAIVDYETRRVQSGVRLERTQIGTRSERRIVRHRSERVQVGTREERRIVGYDTEWVVTQPAREHVVKVTVSVPAEQVTVVPVGATRTKSLAGTKRILSRTAYEQALAAVP